MADDNEQAIEIWKVKRVSFGWRLRAQAVLAPARAGCCARMRAGVALVLPSEPLLVALQLIKALEAARGNGTSMISLILPPKDQVGP